jgi:hypothetical protein
VVVFILPKTLICDKNWPKLRIFWPCSLYSISVIHKDVSCSPLSHHICASYGGEELYLSFNGSRRAPCKIWGAEQHPLPSMFSLLPVFSSDVAPSDAWKARDTGVEQARGGVGATSDDMIMEEVGEADSGTCSLEARRGGRRQGLTRMRMQAWRGDRWRCARGGGQ